MKKVALIISGVCLAFAGWFGGGGGSSSSSSLSFNAVSSAPNGDAVDDWDNNLTTQIVGEKFTMYVLCKDSDGNSKDANVTQVKFMFFSDGNSTDCNGTNEANQTLCDDNDDNLPNCDDTNSSGEVEMNATINRAARCLQVHIEGKSNSSGDSGGGGGWF